MPLIQVDPATLPSPARIMQSVADQIADIVGQLSGQVATLDGRLGAAAGPAERANQALRTGLTRIGSGYGTLGAGLQDVAELWSQVDAQAIRPRSG